jgi:hypothetical protein
MSGASGQGRENEPPDSDTYFAVSARSRLWPKDHALHTIDWCIAQLLVDSLPENRK